MRTYLDHAATTPPRPEVVEAMRAVLEQPLGNPSGVHESGRRARRLLDDARDRLAAVLGCGPGEIVFTSGGTESDHLAIAGVLAARPGTAVCSAVEHDAVLATVQAMSGTVAPVTPFGSLDLEALPELLDDTTSVVSVMLVNNENGVIQPLDAIADLLRDRAPRAVLHTDAVQAMSWLDVADLARNADLISVSGHKFGAPQGSGALVVRERAPFVGVVRGGGQERDRRGGTANVAGAVALAMAAEIAAQQQVGEAKRVELLADRLRSGLATRIEGLMEPAAAARHNLAPGVLQFCIPGVESEAMLFLLDRDGVDASAGAACSAGALEASHVLSAMGVDDELARGALRLSLGHTSSDADVDVALRVIPAAVDQLRSNR